MYASKWSTFEKQYEYEWRMRHSRVESILADVDKPKRKRKHSPRFLKEENESKRLVIKKEQRDDVIRILKMEDEH